MKFTLRSIRISTRVRVRYVTIVVCVLQVITITTSRAESGSQEPDDDRSGSQKPGHVRSGSQEPGHVRSGSQQPGHERSIHFHDSRQGWFVGNL